MNSYLPLPRVYRPFPLLQVVLLSVGIPFILMLLGAFTITLIGLITSQISLGLPFLLASICVCILSPFAVLASCMYLLNLLWMKLELMQEGILLVTLSQRLFTPWSNIVSFRDLRNSPEIELRQAAEKIPVEEGILHNIAAQEVSWWYIWWNGSRAVYFISVPQIFGVPAWNISETELYLRKYASQAFRQ